MMIQKRLITLFVAVIVAAGCATPSRRADDIATDAGFTKAVIDGAGFRHVTYTANASRSGPVWIYMEGDGIPWLADYIPARDPTPRTLVALEAMAAGPVPALYLGRPCYFEVNADPQCEPTLWTHRRFAAELVDSMVVALRNRLDILGLRERSLVLVGFSGGGTLATLMARRMPEACALITMASALDLDEWARARGYSPLAGSEDPARIVPLDARVRQLHLRGRADRVVPATNGAAYLFKHPAAELRIVDELAHDSRWVAAWRDLTQDAAALLPLGGCR